MKMNAWLLLAVEEAIQKRRKMLAGTQPVQKIDPKVKEMVQRRIDQGKKEATLFDLIETYLRRLDNKNFYKKNGELNEAAFCRYAMIDKSTWSSLRYNLIVPKKKTLLKLVIALKLNEDEAADLMHKGRNSFDLKDLRDQIILALIDIRCYDIEEVYEVLEEYRSHGAQPFENIYDTKDMK